MNLKEFLLVEDIKNQIGDSEIVEVVCYNDQIPIKIVLDSGATIGSIAKFVNSRVANICSLALSRFEIDKDNKAKMILRAQTSIKGYPIYKLLADLLDHARECGLKAKSIG